ncbi:MAG: hypothetical protein A2Y12_00525 [Planctomycetes bacterium GWF2_42_9]|nr:MAG: hypothetical protein A2Y12_00525 [Planctomycetes bacterium GWF2_42_9]
MKTYILLMACFFAAFSGTTLAASINIISQTHHVWGWITTPHSVRSYDYTDDISINENAELWNSISESSAGDFQVSAYTFAAAETGPGISASAESYYNFTPITTSLTLNISGYISPWAHVAHFELTDLTDRNTVLVHYYLSEPYPNGVEINWDQDFQVDPSHQYRLWMYVSGLQITQIDYDKFANAELNAVFTPELGTMVMFSLGVGLMRKFRAKHVKCKTKR